MAGVMDELREHQAALEAIGESARDLKRLLGLVRAELPPTVRMLRELSSDIERPAARPPAGGLRLGATRRPFGRPDKRLDGPGLSR